MGIIPFFKDDHVEESVSNAITEAQDQVEELDDSGAEWSPSDEDNTDKKSISEHSEAEIQKLKAHMEGLKEQQNALRDKNERISEKIGALRENLRETQEDAQKAFSNSEKAAELVEEVHPEEIDKKLSQMKAEHSGIQDRLNEAEERRGDLRNRIRKVKSQLDEIGSFEAVKQLRDDAESMLKTSQKLSEESKINANKIEDIFRTLQEKSAKIQKMGEKQEELQQKSRNNTERINNLEVNYTDLPSKDKFQEIKKQYESTVEEIEEVIPAVEKAFEDIENLEEGSVVTKKYVESEINNLESSTPSKSEISEIRESLKTVQNNQDRLTASLKEINHGDIDHNKIKEKLNLMEENMRQMEKRIQRAEVEEKSDTSELERKVEELKNRSVTDEEYAELHQDVEEMADIVLKLVNSLE